MEKKKTAIGGPRFQNAVHYTVSANSIPFFVLSFSTGSLSRNPLRLAGFASTRIRSGVFWLAGVLSKPSDMGTEKPAFMCAYTDSPRASGRRLSSSSLRKGQVFRLTPGAPIFRGLPTGIDAFLEPPSVSGLESSTWAHFRKCLVPYSSGR